MMCGIAGWVSYDRDLTRDMETIRNMTATMANRGPDASGIWVRSHVALGHRRLSVIDLAGGAQPMTVQRPDGAVAMVYSGEAYNFTELRRQLEVRGHRFLTVSDTEVVLRSYLEWGDAVAERLSGMYALAIWDERANKLVLIRDRMGIKPLYYYPTKDGVLFGSEPKAILANSLAQPAVDAAGLRRMLAPIGVAGGSPWKDITEVDPGTVLTVRASGLTTRTYWRLSTRPHHDDRASTVETVRGLLTETVHRQLVADVPQCVLLSGGLDSSSITALAATYLASHGEQVRTFSVDFANLGANFVPNELFRGRDTPYADDVAALVRSQHETMILDPARLDDPELRRAIVRARDMPGFGELDASLYLLFTVIRQHATVALSGESADELFGGYYWFNDEASRATDTTFPWLAAPRDMSLGRPPVRADVMRDADLPAFVADRYADAVASLEYLDDEDGEDRRMRRMSHLFLTHFVRDWLDRKDRMSMAIGLEVRVPFCDHRLVEYVYNVPWSLKTFDGREKSILRHAMKDQLPSSVVERGKSGYPSSHDPRYTAALQQRAKEVLADANAVFALVDRGWLEEAARCDPMKAPKMLSQEINWVLDLADWFELYKPTLSGLTG